MKVHVMIFQLKGSALLWWKTFLPQLNMPIEDISWELFEEQFRERHLSEEFIERQLNEFNTLCRGVVWCPSTRPTSWSCFGMLRT
jgi:hypothetical protein